MDAVGAAMISVSARGLVKRLGRGRELFELRVPELDLAPRSVTALVGPSGSGKSTLLDMLGLLSRPDEAERFILSDGVGAEIDVMALWRGGDEDRLGALRRRMGFVFQDGGLLPFLDVAGNAALARRLAGLEADRALIERTARTLGVEDRLGAAPRTLSGGERQRAAILRALAHGPGLLLTDEPTAAVDRPRAEAIMAALTEEVDRRAAAAVIVSHDVELVGSMTDRIYRFEVERRADDGVSFATCRAEASAARPRSGSAAPEPDGAAAAPASAASRIKAPLHLAMADLIHDARQTAALIAGIAAVIAPLLLLFGLKFGVVQHQLTRLIENPRTLELTPTTASSATPERLEGWRARPDVAFVTPGIARGAASVVLRSGARARRRVDLIATQPGDPLLRRGGAADPAAGEIVLSYGAAAALLREIGEAGAPPASMTGRRLDVDVGRRVDGRRQVASRTVRVAGVLAPRVEALDRIYAPLGFVRRVELYRSGAIDEWTQQTANAAPLGPRYDAVLVVAGADVDPVDLAVAAERAGAMAPARLLDPRALFGAPAPGPVSEGAAFLLKAPGATLADANVAAAASELAAADAVVTPIAGPIDVRFEREGGSVAATLIGEPPPGALERIGLRPAIGPEGVAAARAAGAVPIAAPPALAPVGSGGRLWVSEARGGLSAPALVVAASEGRLRAPSALVAQIRAGLERRARFDPAAHAFVSAELNYRSFRLYARSIYDVEALHAFLREEGFETRAQLGPIQTVRELDEALGAIFALVAAIGVVGAATAMGVNMFSAFERKRADVALLRVLGLRRRGAFALPIVQALAISAAALALAAAAYAVASAAVNAYIAPQLPFGERLCYIPTEYFGVALVMTTGAGTLCALFAARRAATVDPARALRPG